MTMLPAPPDSKRRALGKGLESLLPRRPAAILPAMQASGESESAVGKPLEIAVGEIDRNPFQTRTRFDEAQLAELAQSIAATGVVQPVVVRRLHTGRYQLITGERRLMASKKVGKTHIPAIVRQVSDEQAMEMTIVENLQRADLNPIEQARAYQRLAHDFRMTQEQMASRTGSPRATVANFLRLLKLPVPVQEKVEAGALSFGHAKTLLALESPEAISAAAQKVLALAMSVRQTETYVQGLLDPESKPKMAKIKEPLDPNVREARDLMQRKLGIRVSIEDKDGRGRVVLHYANLGDFDSILGGLGLA